MPNFFLSYKRIKVPGCMTLPPAVTRDLGKLRRDPAQGPPDSAVKLAFATEARKRAARDDNRSDRAMKQFTGWVISPGLVFSAATANAQGLVPYEIGRPVITVSDVSGPYAAAMPPEAPMPGYGPRYYAPSYEPALLPPQEVYAILRDNGFSPLGIPRQRGLFYVIGVIDRGGEDGRLVIDARNGRIIRFMPAFRMGSNYSYNEGVTRGYDGPVGALPPMSDDYRGAPRPPVSVPKMASRTPPVPLPKAAPPHAAEIKPELKPLAARPASEPPAQQSAAVQAGPADTPPSHPPAAVPIVEAKPSAPQIQPTQAMPKPQGLD
jgi:hypothetical protein